MSTSTLGRPTERVATWEEYLALGDHVRAEYVDGKIVMAPSPTRRHQRLARRLATALEDVLPEGYAAETAWAWKPSRDEFIPDVLVFAETTEDLRLTSTPALAVEVLSSNRRDDLVRKVQKYARAGLPHHWILDPADGSFDAFALSADGLFEAVLHLDAGESAEVDFGVGRLTVDVAALLR